jgi:membrane protein required for colicin V production
VTGSPVDLAVLALLLLFAVAGAFSGALRQLVQLAAVVAGWLAARHGSARAAGLLFGEKPLPWQRAAAAAGVFLAVFALVALAGRALARLAQGPEGRPGPLDRLLGAAVGAAKAGLLAWVLLSALALAGGPLALGPLRVDPAGSRAAALAARHNLLEAADPELARRLRKLLEATRDPAARERLLREDPGLRRLLDDPRVRRLLERHRGDPDAALEDPEVRGLLERSKAGR